jgi:hypothetical protein
MARRNFFRTVFCVFVISILGSAQASPLPREQDDRVPVLSFGDSNADNVLNCFRSALATLKLVGRIDYQAVCLSQPTRLSFPSIDTHALSHGENGLIAFQQMFNGDKDVAVTEVYPGVIRIGIGHVPESLLQTKISNLTITADEQSDYHAVLRALRSNEAVKAEIKRLGFQHANYIDIYPTSLLPSRQPQFPLSMHHVSVEQVLDRIALTFKGVVLYGACENRHLYEFFFMPISVSPRAP